MPVATEVRHCRGAGRFAHRVFQPLGTESAAGKARHNHHRAAKAGQHHVGPAIARGVHDLPAAEAPKGRAHPSARKATLPISEQEDRAGGGVLHKCQDVQVAVAIGIPRGHKRDVLVTGHALGRRKTARAIAQQQKHTVARPRNNVHMTVLVPVARNNMLP